MKLEVITPQPDALLTPAANALSVARDMVIENDEDYQLATNDLKAVKARRLDVDNLRKKVLEPIREAQESINLVFKPALDAYEQAEALIRQKGSAYLTDKEARQAEERRKLEAAAAAERARLEEAAQRQRIEAAKEADRLRAEAEKASESRDSEGAAHLAAAASAIEAEAETKAHIDVAIAQTIVAPAIEEGSKGRGSWEPDVKDLAAMIRWVAANPAYANCLKADLAQLKRVATATNGTLKIDGVVFSRKQSMVAR